MAKKYDVPEGMKEETPFTMISSFVLAGLFGIPAAFIFDAGRTVVYQIMRFIFLQLELSSEDGYKTWQFARSDQFSQLFPALFLGALWLFMVLFLWHKLDHRENLKQKLQTAFIWICVAACIALISYALGDWLVNVVSAAIADAEMSTMAWIAPLML